VRTGDRGIDKNGERKPNFEPGVDITAPIVVLADGSRGNLTKVLVEKLQLDEGRNPQIYATGVKEVWEVPADRIAPGEVFHTLGWPLSNEEYGGGFIYGMRDHLVSIGLAVGLDYRNPWTDPHGLMQDWKRHPMLSELLEGGKMLHYGAKTIPEGGFFSVPRAAVDGCLVIGDAAGYLNAARLKGIHLAIKTGMLAAETAAEAVAGGDFSQACLAAFEKRVAESWVCAELRGVRNFRQSFRNNFRTGLLRGGFALVTGGGGLGGKMEAEPDHTHMLKLDEMTRRGRSLTGPTRTFDGRRTFDKLTSVYASEAKHEEDQPSHLQIADPEVCNTRCRTEYGNPCQYFCPASVYEMVAGEDGTTTHLQVSFTNCVHCKTCDIADPYQIINWVPPEGVGGPNYVNL
jgi:electron-transferring-flavoprotein dehydrogenase